MSLKATVLFESPQNEIASLLSNKLTTSSRTEIVTGFATVEGVDAIHAPISANPGVVETFLVGAGTYRAFDALENLSSFGVPPDSLRVHLGYTRLTTTGARHRFYRYHPMLHSKIYYTEQPDGGASVFIGSNNVTGFALLGLNGEASVLLEGDKDSPEFAKVRQHIAAAKADSVVYSSASKESFAWWSHQFFEGLADKANDAPKEGEGKRTIVIICESSSARPPRRNDLLYFELRSALGTVQSLNAEVHIFVFDRLPPTPLDALRNLDSAIASYWCRPVGLEMRRGGIELRADWHLTGDKHPVLTPTTRPFRPRPAVDMQQVRVQIYGGVHGRFDYLFEGGSPGWIPVLDHDREVLVPAERVGRTEALGLVPPEHLPWSLVRGLEPMDHGRKKAYYEALAEMSPESGSFVLMSLRRKERER